QPHAAALQRLRPDVPAGESHLVQPGQHDAPLARLRRTPVGPVLAFVLPAELDGAGARHLIHQPELVVDADLPVLLRHGARRRSHAPMTWAWAGRDVVEAAPPTVQRTHRGLVQAGERRDHPGWGASSTRRPTVGAPGDSPRHTTGEVGRAERRTFV